ncbi:unnamed protein product [Cylindrotheca closterium]|uniref:Uncharacterized protein n=1 Tax=Cylindrotheca closterium TaxID=2856 RepID=A0AAD2JNY4_9STRA|nr:unnamed protein product [Cylindrotheca closterium]
MSNRSHNVITLDRKAKRSKADPDAIMIESEVKASSSSTSNEDTDMANSEHGNEEEKESTAYEMLVKDSVQQQWSEDYDGTLKKYLTIIGKAKEFPDAQAVNFRHDAICEAVVAAFQGNQDMISAANSAMKTTSALAITSLNFLKHQQERLKIENEMPLYGFLHTVCMEVLKEDYKRKSEAQKQSANKNIENQRVNLFHDDLRKHEDPNNVVFKFCKHLNGQIAQWGGGDTYFAGYTVLFQSSGMGKTHLIFSSLKSKIFGVYLCFRRSTDGRTYPPRSPVMNWLIQSEVEDGNTTSLFQSSALAAGTLPSAKTTRHMLRFLAVMRATQELFESWFDEWKKEKENPPTPEDWFNHQKGGEETDFLVFQTKLKNRANVVWEERRFENQAGSKDGFEDNFIFFMDEGRTLLEENIFRDVRRCFCKGYFSTRHLDSSARATSVNQGYLLPPFYFVNCLDLFIDSNNNNELSKYGRPLWHAYEMFLQKNKNRLTMANLLQFARFKLLRSEKLLAKLDGDHKKAAAIACLACRAALRIHPGRRFASELVGGHMAVCSHVYNDREAILINYPSEPILAEGSRSALLGPEADFSGWKTSLEQLQLAIQEADVDTGKIGELIHRIVLLLAMDMAKMEMAGRSKHKGVSAYDFLKVLVGDSIDASGNGGTQIENLKTKYVWFNHFLPLYYVPDASAFEQIARRRAATVCKPGQNGIDHEIPLMDATYSNVVGTLAIQTKNVVSKHDSDYPASAGWKLGREFAFHGSDRDGSSDSASDFYYFALYHNIGYQRSHGTESFECEQIEPSTHAHVWTCGHGQRDCYSPIGLKMVGLDLPLFQSTNEKLCSNVKQMQKSLKQMRDQGRSPIAHFTDEMKTSIGQLTPLAYATVAAPDA